MGPFLLENQLCRFRQFTCNSAEKETVFHTFPIKNGMISQFLLIIPQRPVRESNPHLVLYSLNINMLKFLVYVTLSKIIISDVFSSTIKLCRHMAFFFHWHPAVHILESYFLYPLLSSCLPFSFCSRNTLLRPEPLFDFAVTCSHHLNL